MLAFHVSLAFLTVHELDAIRCKEWRIFPGLSLLDDRYGIMTFIFAHVPLFVWIFYNLSGIQAESSSAFRIGFAIFSVIHILLHALLFKNLKNEYRDWVSWTLIIGAGVFGLVDLLILWRLIS